MKLTLSQLIAVLNFCESFDIDVKMNVCPKLITCISLRTFLSLAF